MSKSPKILAHRYGNNARLIEKAIRNDSVDAIECDVRFERGKLVVRHNRRFRCLPFTIERWCRGITFRSYMKELLLEDVIYRMRGTQKQLFLDLKVQNISEIDSFVSALLPLLAENKRPEAFAVSSKNMIILETLHAKMREERVHGVGLFYSVSAHKELLINPYKGRLRFLSGISARKDILDRGTVLAFRHTGLKVYAWTVRSGRELAQFLEKDIDGIFTDCLPKK